MGTQRDEAGFSLVIAVAAEGFMLVYVPGVENVIAPMYVSLRNRQDLRSEEHNTGQLRHASGSSLTEKGHMAKILFHAAFQQMVLLMESTCRGFSSTGDDVAIRIVFTHSSYGVIQALCLSPVNILVHTPGLLSCQAVFFHHKGSVSSTRQLT